MLQIQQEIILKFSSHILNNIDKVHKQFRYLFIIIKAIINSETIEPDFSRSVEISDALGRIKDPSIRILVKTAIK